jgi:hypothetical protein
MMGAAAELARGKEKIAGWSLCAARLRKTLVRTKVYYTTKIQQYWQNCGFEYVGFEVAPKHHSIKNTTVFSNTTILLQNCKNTMLPNTPLGFSWSFILPYMKLLI